MTKNKLIIVIIAAIVVIGGYLYFNNANLEPAAIPASNNNIEGINSDLDAALNSVADPDVLQDELKEQDLDFDVSF